MWLPDHMKETADIISGYTTGRLIIENGTVSLQRENGEEIKLTDSHLIEVRNEDVYEHITIDQALMLTTAEGWPLMAGMHARIK